MIGKTALHGNLYPSSNRYVATNPRLKAISTPEPSYPGYFERAGVSAWAIVHYDVNEDGNTENATVVASFPVDALSEYVLAAVQSWKYDPPKDLYCDAIRLEMQSHTFQIKAPANAKARKFERENAEYLDAIRAAAEAESGRYQ